MKHWSGLVDCWLCSWFRLQTVYQVYTSLSLLVFTSADFHLFIHAEYYLLIVLMLFPQILAASTGTSYFSFLNDRLPEYLGNVMKYIPAVFVSV